LNDDGLFDLSGPMLSPDRIRTMNINSMSPNSPAGSIIFFSSSDEYSSGMEHDVSVFSESTYEDTPLSNEVGLSLEPDENYKDEIISRTEKDDNVDKEAEVVPDKDVKADVAPDADIESDDVEKN